MWLQQRSKKIVKRRKKKQNKKKRQRRNAINYNVQLKKKVTYNEQIRSYCFKAPNIFSLLKNTEKTSLFFEEIINFLSNKHNYGKNLFIDLSQIEELTIDALMYLLVLINNLDTKLRHNFKISGNVPNSEVPRRLLNESGFRSFVKFRKQEVLNRNTNNLQIVSGNNSDTQIAQRISDFLLEKAGITLAESRFLYIMMIEFMSNTHKHAYNSTSIFNPMWYCFAEYRVNEDIIAFTFMDTGEGIPATVRKKFIEKINILKIKDEDKYVISALEGEFRTATSLKYRGKGLPKIREFCTEKKIQEMRIITNKADVRVNSEGYNSRLLGTSLKGTLFSWEIKLSSLKGAKANDNNNK